MESSFFFLALLLLLLLLCSLNKLPLSLATTPLPNSTTDQNALLALKNTITNISTTTLAGNWSGNTSVCDWIGITCGNKHQRVISLNISGFALSGTLPPHLGNLTFLGYIDISSNDFRGPIPSELSRLYHLRYINMGFNSFAGEIPSWLGDLPRLEILGLQNNTFSGNIPPSLFNNNNSKQLQILSMSFNSLNGIIPEEIGNCTSLQILNLNYNQLTGTIPYGIFNLSSIREIRILGNYLSGRLPSDICNNLPNLTRLSISRNRIEGQIPPNIWKCRELEILSLSFNRFNGEIPSEIASLSMLRELYLGINEFKGGVPAELGNLRRLEIISIAGASLTGPIPKQIGNCTSLVILELKDNYLTEYGLEGKVSTSGDVYSYGILMLEIFTRKKPTDDMFNEQMNLKDWVHKALQENAVSEVVAPDLLESEDEDFSANLEECISSIFSLSMKCLAVSPNVRINMIETGVSLQRINAKVVVAHEKK